MSQYNSMMESFSSHDVQIMIYELYGMKGKVQALNGEQDFNFYLRTDDQQSFLLKISRKEESKDHLLLQNAVLHWLQGSVQSFQFPSLQLTLKKEEIGIYQRDSQAYFVRLFTFLPGKLFSENKIYSDNLLKSLGTQLAHLTLALQNFHSPFAKRYSKWDIKNAGWIKDRFSIIEDKQEQACLTYFFHLFESEAKPLLPYLPQRVIHGDINDHNIVIHEEHVIGFIDFGDVVETAGICELAIALAYVMLEQPDPFQTALQVIRAYHHIYPLDRLEVDLLYSLIGIRLCMSVVNAAICKKENPDNIYLTISEKPAWDLLKKWHMLNPVMARSRFREACEQEETHASKQTILSKRKKWIAKNVGLAYQQPLQLVRGKGPYLFDETGRRYLDCINNVAHVGHCHPKVVEAGQKQMALLNTNTRYLDENLSLYAEQLINTFPSSLKVCFFVCTGSEANELALRLAMTHTKRKNFLVLDHAYHGNTTSLIQLSPYKFNGPGGEGKPHHVQVLPLPKQGEIEEDFALHLQSIDPRVAAFIAEPLLSCAGQIILPPHYFEKIYSLIRQTGGVCIADEVQVGLGRVGTHFWGFQTQNVIPDIVTIGKPLGNGHPIAAVVTTEEIAASFYNGMEYFNTFGGNPVSCAIGLSVLNVLQEENLQEHALEVGEDLKQKLRLLQKKYSFIQDVRGTGLFLGIEFSDNTIAKNIVNLMKENSVLLSIDGPLQNVIKIKPPMVFSINDTDFLIEKLFHVLKSFS